MRRRRRSLYPLWVGIVSSIGLAVAWVWLAKREVPTLAEPAPPASAGAPATVPPAPAEPPALSWRVVGRTGPPGAEGLERCLRDRGERGAVVASEPGVLVVRVPGLEAPARVELTGGGAVLSTPFTVDRPLLIAVHVATAACLREPGATLHDDALDRRFSSTDWPAPTASGGVAVDAVIALDAVSGTLASRGLARLRLPEVAHFVGPDPAGDRRLLQQVVSSLIAGGVPPDGRLVTADGATLTLVSPAASPRALPPLPSADRRVVLLAPPAPVPATPRPSPPPRPRPAAPAPVPAFRPDYR